MPVPPSLDEIFLANALVSVGGLEAGSDLDGILKRVFEAARASWPDLALTAGQFIEHIARHLPEDGDGRPLQDVLKAMPLSDLYLACACALSVPRAAEALDREYLSKVPGILKRHRYSAELVDDVCQKLREKLILRNHISSYSGAGKLVRWVEVIAKRIANKATRTGAGGSSGLSKLAEEIPTPRDLEQDVLKKDLLAAFHDALREAIAILPAKQREMLRFKLCDRLSEAKIATILHTSQPTISRWLALARETLIEETRRRLQARLRLEEEELSSFISDVQSRLLDLSLSRLLGGSNG